MAKTVRVLAGVVALPEKIEEVESLLHALIKETRKEAGCVQYELLQNRDDPAEFTFVEEWEDDSAIDAHFARAHMQTALSKAAHLLAVEPGIRRYSAVQ
jgi:quinol monooxygenase YgiN